MDFNPYDKSISVHHKSEVYEDLEKPRRDGTLYASGHSSSFFTEKIDPQDDRYMHPTMAANRAGALTITATAAAAASLISFILSWIIYSRTRSGLCLWFALMETLFLILGASIAYLGFTLRKRIFAEHREQVTFTAFIFMGAALSAVFLLISVLIFLVYRYFQFNNLMGVYENKSLFASRYSSDGSFYSSWRTDRRMIWWIAFFNLIAGLAFALVTFLIWTISKHMLYLTRALLALAGAISVLFLSLALYRAAESRAIAEHSSVRDFIQREDWTFVLWMAIIIGAILIVNLYFNIYKHRSVYLIVGLVLLVASITLAVKVTHNLRVLRQNLAAGSYNTNASVNALKYIYEEDLSSVCSKYVTIGTSCGRELDTPYFEASNTERSLDPACARAAREYMLRPMLYCGVFTLIAVALASIVVACDLYLSDAEEVLEIYNKRVSLFEVGGLVIALIILVVATIWIGLSSFKRYREPPHESADISERLQRGSIVEPKFTVVPQSISQADQPVNGVCTAYEATQMISLDINPNCQISQCGYRVFILGEAIEFANVPIDARGTPNMRSLAFPNARNQLDGFIFIFGTATQINRILSNMRFCTLRHNEPLSIFYKIESVNLNLLTSDGRFVAENPAAPQIREDRDRGFPTGYSFVQNSVCAADACLLENRLSPSGTTAQITGSLFAKSTSGTYVIPPNSLLDRLTVEAFHGQTLYTSIPAGTLPLTGVFILDVPTSTTAYPLKVVIKDINNSFLPSSIEIIVPTTPGSQLSMGRIPLILPSGQGCVGSQDFISCVSSNLVLQRGVIIVKVIDSDTNESVSGVDFVLQKGHHLGASNQYDRKISDEHGIATFYGIEYGIYTIVSYRIGFRETAKHFVLESNQTFATVFLAPIRRTAMDLTLLITNTADSDTDLKLKFRTDTGLECEVTSENKYCGYALYLYDVAQGQSGIETVRVHNLTVAHYLVYSQTYFTQYQVCSSALNANSHFSQSSPLDWETLSTPTHTQSSPLIADRSNPYWIGYCFTGFGAQSLKAINQRSATEPSIDLCAALFPAGSTYSLSKLRSLISQLT